MSEAEHFGPAAQITPPCRLCGREILTMPLFRVTIEQLSWHGFNRATDRRAPFYVHKACAELLDGEIAALARNLNARANATRDAGAGSEPAGEG